MSTTAAEFLRAAIPPSMQGKVWNALITALATAEQTQWDNAPKVRDALYLSSATGQSLDKRAADAGIARPADIGLSDEAFRTLAVTIAAEKLTPGAMDRVLEVLYGLRATHAHARSLLSVPGGGTANFQYGNTFSVTFDGTDTVNLYSSMDLVGFADFAWPLASLAQAISHVCAVQGWKHFATMETDPATGDQTLALYSGTPGLRGSVTFDDDYSRTLASMGQRRYLLSDYDRPAFVADQTMVLPAVSDTVARELGQASYIGEPVVEGDDDSTPGPFLFADIPFQMGPERASLAQGLSAAADHRILVLDSTAPLAASGEVVVGFGHRYQAGPVPYEKLDGTRLLLTQPVRFQATVPSGTWVNQTYSPRLFEDGESYSAWVTPSQSARVAASRYALDLSAGGMTIRQSIIYPGGYGLGAADAPTHGAQRLHDLVRVFAGDDVQADLDRARED